MFKSQVIGNKVHVAIDVETTPENAKRLLEIYLDLSPVEKKETVDEAIRRCIKQGKNKLETVKEMKQVFGLSLKEAKDLCDPFPFPVI